MGLGNIFKDGPINLRRTGDMGSKKGSEKPEPTEPKVRAPTQPKEDKVKSTGDLLCKRGRNLGWACPLTKFYTFEDRPLKTYILGVSI